MLECAKPKGIIDKVQKGNLMNTNLKQFKLSGYIEGWSFILLLFVAMPLKYMMGFAIATKIVGMVHGGLFVWFLYALYNATLEQKWGAKFTILAFISSLIPFGTFFLNKRLDLILIKNTQEI